MRNIFYHCMPTKYYDAQINEYGFKPYYGAVWLAETHLEAWQGNQTPKEKRTMISIDTTGLQLEDHSDMPVCKRTGRRYYILRTNFVEIDRIKKIG